MKVNRRGFLGACIALAAAPAIVRASSLMPVRARPTSLREYFEAEQAGWAKGGVDLAAIYQRDFNAEFQVLMEEAWELVTAPRYLVVHPSWTPLLQRAGLSAADLHTQVITVEKLPCLAKPPSRPSSWPPSLTDSSPPAKHLR